MKHEHSPVRWLAAMGLALMVEAGGVQAADVLITARYIAGVDREFENTTPPSGWCNGVPELCDGMETIGLPITYKKISVAYAPDVKDRYYMRLPGSRKVTVSNDRGETHTLDLMFSAISQNMWSHSGNPPTFGGDLRGGCAELSSGYDDPTDDPSFVRWSYYAWRILDPSSPLACYSDSTDASAGDRYEAHVESSSIGYRLLLPNPNRMRQGVYSGSVVYRIGPGLDIDPGNNVSELNDSTLTVHFELNVEHALDIRFPPRFEEAVLEPPGGWQAWMAGRGAPPKLHRDLPFFLWSTGPFSVFRRCEHQLADQCAIRNAQGRQVPVQVALTLPRTATMGNAPIDRVPIPHMSAAPLRVEQSTAMADERSQLHFMVDKAGVDEMVRDPGSTYRGDVTVVFDADL